MLSNRIRDVIDEQDYPLTTAELVEVVGEGELHLHDCTETVGDALGRLEAETFETPEDVRLAVYTGVSSEAIGRKGYSDREPSTGDGAGDYEQVSF